MLHFQWRCVPFKSFYFHIFICCEALRNCLFINLTLSSFGDAFQIGAIFLWSFVYNIVRVSSRRPAADPRFNDLPISARCSEASLIEEPLIHNQSLDDDDDSSQKLLVLEDDEVIFSSEAKHEVFFGMFLLAHHCFRSHFNILESSNITRYTNAMAGFCCSQNKDIH